MKKIIIIFSLAVSVSCSNDSEHAETGSATNDESPPLINFTVVNSFPHDTTSFTEGFLIHEGHLFESTGHTDSYASSRSLFGVVDLASGKIQTKAEIDKNKYFGEGIVFLNGKVYQLTDTTKVGFLYDAKTYMKLGQFHYEGDGWGLTTDGVYVIMSNGTSNIVYRDAASFKSVKIIPVTDNNGPVSNINELELINGYIYANQWLTNYILKINISNGKVVGKLDLSSLSTEAKLKYIGSAEMNGIAYDSLKDKIYITGKLWPYIFEIKFSH